MKQIKIYISLLFLGLFGASCETEMIDRLDEFGLEQGGYIRTVTPLTNVFSLSKANMTGTKMEIVAEAVTPEFGALFSSYDLVVRFVDATPDNGNNSKPDAALRSIPASAFSKDPVTNYPRLTITITGKQAQDALALTDAQISSGDRFEVRGTMRLTNGRSFNANNTGANITGGAFYSSPFFYRLNILP